MRFTNIKDLKYITANNSHIDLIATCKEYGEIPMTLNLIDTEDLHVFASGKFEVVLENEVKVEKEILIPLEEYCKTLKIAPYVEPLISKEQKKEENINISNQYLKDTDWIATYKIRHDLGLEIIPEYSSKWLIINKRDKYIAFLKGL